MTPSSSLINLLEWLPEFRKTVDLLFTRLLQRVMGKDTVEHPGGRGVSGKVRGKRLPCPLSDPVSQRLHELTSQDAP